MSKTFFFHPRIKHSARTKRYVVKSGLGANVSWCMAHTHFGWPQGTCSRCDPWALDRGLISDLFSDPARPQPLYSMWYCVVDSRDLIVHVCAPISIAGADVSREVTGYRKYNYFLASLSSLLSDGMLEERKRFCKVGDGQGFCRIGIICAMIYVHYQHGRGSQPRLALVPPVSALVPPVGSSSARFAAWRAGTRAPAQQQKP